MAEWISIEKEKPEARKYVLCNYTDGMVAIDFWIESIGGFCFETRKNACVLGGKTKRKPVIKIDQDGNELEIYPSVAAAAKANFMSPSAVASRCRREMENPFLRCEWDFRYEDGKSGRPKKRRGVKRNEQ